MDISKPTRSFVAADLKIDRWESIETYYQNLLERSIDTLPDFKQWLSDQSELEAVLEENAAWRYI
ncbi:MAG: oligoendopeptidase F, partial [Fluviicola sp.]